MNSDSNDPTGRRTSEADDDDTGVTGSVLEPGESDLEADELGIPATQATGGLVPEGAEDDQP